MLELREGGIYRLPNGKELIAGLGGRAGHVFYTPQTWEHRGLAEYEVDARGKIILNNGVPTVWHIEDLTDTKQTAHARSR